MHFRTRRPMPIMTWLATPLLFIAAVLGLTGLGGVLLGADWRVALSSALFGPAAAVTALLAGTVEWRVRRYRWYVGIGYPVLVFVVGLGLSHITLPAPLALVVGAPAVIALAVLISRERNKVVPIA